jgi:hypothetical protein
MNLWQKIKALLYRFRIPLLIIIPTAAVAASYGGYRAWDYTQNDPNFCTSCHLMDDAFGRWQKSGHRDVNCHTCHPGDIASNLHQLYMTVTHAPKTVEKHAEVPASICSSCHRSGEERWTQISETPGHKIHFEEHKIECVTCHAPAVHDFVPNDAMCQKCHGDKIIELAGMAQNHCTSCHDFLGDAERGLLAAEETCGGCHVAKAGSEPATKVSWHDSLDCTNCHPVHDREAVTAAFAGPKVDGNAVACGACHEDQAEMAEAGPSGHLACTTCHTAHADPPGEAACRDCHTPQAEAVPEADHHACQDCHPVHTEAPSPKELCGECHLDQSEILLSTPVEEHRTCDSCHEPHASAKPDGPVCAECHKAEARKAAGAPVAEHRACASCHQVHGPEDARTCRSCHQEQRAATRRAPKEHQDCAECHRQHGTPRASISSCFSCHEEQAKNARKAPPEHRDCRGCHDPHDPKTARKQDCTSCHEEVVKTIATAPADHQQCTNCHDWHGKSLAVPVSRCASCHEEQKPVSGAPSGHSDCDDCHAPHNARPPKQCGECHRKNAQLIHRSGLAELQDCSACHGTTHKVRTPKPQTVCLDCHKDIRAPDTLHAAEGHEECSDCHSSHLPRPPDAAGCWGCHKEEEINDHPEAAIGATTCQGCHRFH